MRVVLSGYYGFDNTGDEAVLAGMLRTMRESDPELEVTVLSGNPPETERVHAVRAIGRTSVRSIARQLRASDGLVSGGGSLLQDTTSARPVAYYAGLMGLARLARRPYIVHAQGIGPISRTPNRMLAGMALRHAAYVSLRDPESIALARELGVRRPIDLVPDAALALRVPRGPAHGPLVVCVRPWGRTMRHVRELRQALVALAAEHEIVALSMQDRVDHAASEAVVSGIPGAAVAPAGMTLHERLRLIGSASAVIGMRLHALVLAAAAGVPAVAIAYDPKVTAFARLVGQELAGDVTGALDPAAVAGAVRRALGADLDRYRSGVDELRAGLLPAATTALAALRGE